jgi:hypothetical protein
MPKPNEVSDVFDGEHYKTLLGKCVTAHGRTLLHRFFSDCRDLALGLSTDGFCPYKRQSQTCWPIIIFNYNLPPDIRFHLDRILCIGIIPGPRQTKDLDSFLVPLVEELLDLEQGVQAYDIRNGSMFDLHAYLILVFGNIPAVAKLMRMKGHNAKCPCRACNIIGVCMNGSTNYTYYIPLHCDGAALYNALDLPLCMHAEFLQNACEVTQQTTDKVAEECAMCYGIKGVPLLASLSSLKFPTSFPYDFMHLVWENIVKSLMLLWTRNFSGLHERSPRASKGLKAPKALKAKPSNEEEKKQPYYIKKTVWDAIGKATDMAGSTIPSAFGCCMPDIAQQQHKFSAEAWSIWAMLLGLVLLCKTFSDMVFYDHFVKLITLINICLRFELSKRNIQHLWTGFAKWVEDYERQVFQLLSSYFLH